MTARLYSQSEVNRIFAHIPSQTLFHWIRTGLVEWSDAHQDRRGKHRLYSLENLWRIGLVEELMSLNLPISEARVLVEVLDSGDKNFRTQIWKDHTLILWKARPGAPKKSATKHEGVSVLEISGWHFFSPLRGDMLLEVIDVQLSDALVVVLINLRSIVIKVEEYMKNAKI